jgi:hypothetical protein
MDERDWKEEQRSVLARLFDTAFKRREAPEHEMEADIHRLDTVNEHLADGASFPKRGRRLIF